jgi:hypothetical protein
VFEVLAKLYGSYHLAICTNKPRKLAEKILSETGGLAFIDDSCLSPCELFELISKSNNLICSNSTFSVLAGQVGAVENVAIPREMSRDGKAGIDGLPKQWLRIEPTWIE